MRLTLDAPKRIALVIALAGWPVFAGSGSVSGQTLDDAIRQGFKNPKVLEADANRRSIDAELRRARSFYLPTIDFRGQYGEGYTDSPFTRSRPEGLVGQGGVWAPNPEISLTLRQLVFDGFDTDSKVDQQIARVKAAAARVGERSEFIAADISEAYLQVLRDQDLVRFADENVSAHERILSDIRTRVRGGRSSIGDLRQAETRLSQARADRADAQRRLEDSKANFLKLVGEEPANLTQPALAPSVLPASREDAVARAKDANPSVRAAKLDIRAAMAEIDIATAPYYPRVDIEVSGTRGENVDGIRGVTRDFSALVVARWNLYRGGGDVANRTAAIERVNEARAKMLRFERDAADDARRAWNAVQKYHEQTIDLQQRVASAVQVVQAYRQQFTVGRRELLDLLDAQNELFVARTALSTAREAQLFAGYRLLAVTGELLRTLNIAPPPEATTPPAKPWLEQIGDTIRGR